MRPLKIAPIQRLCIKLVQAHYICAKNSSQFANAPSVVHTRFIDKILDQPYSFRNGRASDRSGGKLRCFGLAGLVAHGSCADFKSEYDFGVFIPATDHPVSMDPAPGRDVVAGSRISAGNFKGFSWLHGLDPVLHVDDR